MSNIHLGEFGKECVVPDDSWESPFSVEIKEISKTLNDELENQVIAVVCEAGIMVDKEELIKALNYDRNQYEKGYTDACKTRVEVIHCRDCTYHSGSYCHYKYSYGAYVRDDHYCGYAEREECE